MKKILVVLFSLFFFSSVFSADITTPPDQLKFIKIIEKTKSIKYENDVQSAVILEKRNKELKSNIKLKVKNWIGTVKKIKTNKKGYAIVTIAVKTNNNSNRYSFLYIANEENDAKLEGLGLKWWYDVLTTSDRLIKPKSKLYNKISRLSNDDKVKFSGTFELDDEKFLELKHSYNSALIGEPTFIFKFSDIKQIN